MNKTRCVSVGRRSCKYTSTAVIDREGRPRGLLTGFFWVSLTDHAVEDVHVNEYSRFGIVCVVSRAGGIA